MSKVTRVAIAGIGIILFAVAGGEHLYRRLIEYRYKQAVAGQEQAEQQLKQFLTIHQQVKTALTQEQHRSAELSGELTRVTQQLVEAKARVEESQLKTRQLHARLETLDVQMGQLQGELSLALERAVNAPPPQSERELGSAEQGPVQLERVVVGGADAAADMAGHVVSVHKDWSFVVVSLGWDHVKIGDLVSIVREEQPLAQARIERVQEDVSAATILPEWQDVTIQVNDLVKVL